MSGNTVPLNLFPKECAPTSAYTTRATEIPIVIGEYDITAEELLSGAGGNTATKTEQAERLILDLLADGKELASEDIVKAAAEAGISERTVQNAKRNMGGILGARRVGGQWYNFLKKKQPPETAS